MNYTGFIAFSPQAAEQLTDFLQLLPHLRQTIERRVRCAVPR